MFSVEVWHGQSCRVLGAAGQFKDAQMKAEDLAEGVLNWVEEPKGTWKASGVDGARYVIIEHTQD